MLLGCCQLSSHHTAENIAVEVGALVGKFQLKEKVHFMVTDNALNIVKAVKEGLEGVRD